MEQRARFLPIFLTIFIDMLGVGIVIPVLPALFFDADSMVFATGASHARRSMYYGLLLAAYPFMQFFGAPVLGALSDRYGRKPVLQLSLAGTLIGYLLFGTAILTENLWLLFFSRMLPGFTGGNIAIIYSAIADVSDEGAKARNFGLVGMAFGLGFILGPTLGGVLGDPAMVSWFTPSTPFWFTALLTLVNILLVQRYFRETLVRRRESHIHLLKGLSNILASFRAPNLRVIFSVVLLQALGFTFFTQYFSVLLIGKIGAGMKDIGFLFGYVGLWLVLTQGIIVRWLSHRVQSQVILRYSMPLLALAISLLMLPGELWMFYLINPFVAIFHGITSPNLTAVVSAQADRDQQGEILGINQSMISVGQMLPAVIGGWLNAVDMHMPILAASVFILGAWLTYVLVFAPRGRRARG
jgi:MFS transporter, DHA1 family, tetracycline resistance protein